MSKYRNLLADGNSHIKSLRIALICVTLLSAFFAYGWYSAPKKLTIYNPPDLRSGSTRAWWEIDPANVYSFGFYIFQQLNRWTKDGKDDYITNIKQLSPYITPSCANYLELDYQNRLSAGELRNRIRGVYEIPGRGYKSNRVDVVSKDSWRVVLDLTVDEYYLNNPVKRTLVRYPLKVVRYDIDPELNPWGLALDCYFAKPLAIKSGNDNKGEQYEVK